MPSPGVLLLTVARASALRTRSSGQAPDVQVKLRLRRIRLPPALEQSQWETRVCIGTRDPVFEQDFQIAVADANEMQLEVTLWDINGDPEESFLGECILNLAKLIPYQGEIIMQDFDVKQGKTHKSRLRAEGRLVLQLEFRKMEAEEVPVPTPQQANSCALNVTLLEAQNLSRSEVEGDPDAFVCVSIVDKPSLMQQRHFHAIDHGIGSRANDSRFISVRPLHVTNRYPSSSNPAWNEGVTFPCTHPSIEAIETSVAKGSYPDEAVPLDGQPVLVMITVHDKRATDAGKNDFLGRVILPNIRLGVPVEQWFMLQAQDGNQLRSSSGEPSTLRLRIHYGTVNSVEFLQSPTISLDVLQMNNGHHASNRAQQIQDVSINTSMTAKSEGLFAFYIEVIQAQNFPRIYDEKDVYVCASLIQNPTLMEKKHFFLIDHHYGQDVDDNLFYRMKPQYQTPAVKVFQHCEWNSSFTFHSTFPDITMLERLHDSNQILSASDDRHLDGNAVLLLMTVHRAGDDAFIGRIVVPHIGIGKPVDQWFVLQNRDGSQICDELGRVSSIRFRIAYGAQRSQSRLQESSMLSQNLHDESEAEELPPGWQRVKDSESGRKFYVNHQLKTFSWKPPPKSLILSIENSQSQTKQFLENGLTKKTGMDDQLNSGLKGQGNASFVIRIHGSKNFQSLATNLESCFICVSILSETNEWRHSKEIFHTLDYNEQVSESAVLIAPQFKSRNLSIHSNEAWYHEVTLNEVKRVGAVRGPQYVSSVENCDLNGQNVDLLITVHDAKTQEQASLVADAIISDIETAHSANELFTLRPFPRSDANLSNEKPLVHLSFEYSASGELSMRSDQDQAKSRLHEEKHLPQSEPPAHETEQLQREAELHQQELERRRQEEEEEAERQRQEEERLRQEEEQQRQEEEAARQRQRQEEEEAEWYRQQEEQKERQRQEEEAERQRQEEEQQRQEEERLRQEEEQRRQEEEAARQKQRQEEEEAEWYRQQEEQKERQRHEEMEAEHRRQEEAERQRIEDAERQRQEEAERQRQRQQQEEAEQRRQEEEAAERKLREEAERQRQEEEEARQRQRQEEEEAERQRQQREADMQSAHKDDPHMRSPGQEDPATRGDYAGEEQTSDLVPTAKEQTSAAHSPVLVASPEVSSKGGTMAELPQTAPLPSLSSDSNGHEQGDADARASLPTHEPSRPSISSSPALHQGKFSILVVEGSVKAADRSRMMSCEILLEANGFIYPVSKTIPTSGDIGFVWRENFLLGVDVDQIASTRLFFVMQEHLSDEHFKIFGKTKSVALADVVMLGRSDSWLQLMDDKGQLPVQDVAALHVVLEYQQPTVEALVGSVVPPRSPKDEARLSPKSDSPPSTRSIADMSKKDAGVGVVLASAGRGEFVVEYLAEGGPARECGKIAVGDYLSDVDGQVVLGKSLTEIQHLLRGPQNSPVTMTFERRPADPTERPREILVTLMRKKLTMEAGNFAPYGRLQQELIRPSAEPSTRAEKEPRRFPSEQVDPRGKASPKDSQQLSALRSEFGSLLEDLYHGSRDPAMGQVLRWKHNMLFGSKAP